MLISATYDGAASPFEGARTLYLRALPADAQVTRAAARLEPLGGPAFGELFEFGPPDAEGVRAGPWGSAAVPTGTTAVEVHFNARRTLAGVSGRGLSDKRLLADLGGGFVAVNGTGGFGGTDAFTMSANEGSLPRLTVTGFRLATTQTTADLPEVDAVRITSPPSDVTLGLAGELPFFTRVGPLTVAVDVPDFAASLGEVLSSSPVVDGCYVLAFTLSSTSIARLRLRLDLEYTRRAGGLPDGVEQVGLAFGYEGRAPHADLSVTVPAGAVVRSSAGRARGGFRSTAVVAGPVADTPAGAAPAAAEPGLPGGSGGPGLSVTADAPAAQPVTLADTVQVTAVDLRLARVGTPAELRLDLLPDAGGRPGRASLLPTPVSLRLPAEHPEVPTWLSVSLDAPVDLEKGERYWLALLPVAGTVAWATRPIGTPAGWTAAGGGTTAGDGAADFAPGVHTTTDGGLSWRPAAPAPAALASDLRLRRTPREFTVPISLEVGAGAAHTLVPLDRFAPRGGIDFTLDFPEVVQAVTAAAAAGDSCPRGELLADGTVRDWYRTDARLTAGTTAEGSTLRLTPHPDGRRVVGIRGGGASIAVTLIDPRRPADAVEIAIASATGGPTAVAVHPGGAFAAVSVTDDDVSTLHLVSLIGADSPPPLETNDVVPDLAFSPDGRFLYLLESEERRVSRLDLDLWCAAAVQAWPPESAPVPQVQVDGSPTRLAVSPAGTVWVLTTGPALLFRLAADLAGTPARQELNPEPYDLTTVAGRVALVAATTVTVVTEEMAVSTTLPIPTPAGDTLAGTTAADPLAPRLLLARPGSLLVVDLEARTVVPVRSPAAVPTELAVAASGDRGLLVAAPTNGGSGTLVELRLGTLLPLEWTVTAGTALPLCPPGTADSAAAPVAGPVVRLAPADPVGMAGSGIAQVAAVGGGCAYRLSVDAVATEDGARAEVVWRDGAGAALRTDSVAIPTSSEEGAAGTDFPTEIGHVASALRGPDKARQAEVRVVVPTGLATLAAVSLTGVDDALADPRQLETWVSTGNPTVTTDAVGLLVSAGTATAGTLEQRVPAHAGDRFELALRAQLVQPAPGTLPAQPAPGALLAQPAPGARVILSWSTASGVPLPGGVELPITAEGFDLSQASGTVPDGATAARVAVEVQPHGRVRIAALSLDLRAQRTVDIGFISEAPGELTVSGLEVAYDQPAAQPAAPPAVGLVAPEAGPCPECGSAAAPRPGDVVVVPSARPARMAECPRCGTATVRVGGAGAGPAPAVGLPRLRATCPPANRPIPSCSSSNPILLRVSPVPVTAISGIGVRRAAALRERLGIETVGQLAQADPQQVADATGVFLSVAVEWQAEARHRRFAQSPR